MQLTPEDRRIERDQDGAGFDIIVGMAAPSKTRNTLIASHVSMT